LYSNCVRIVNEEQFHLFPSDDDAFMISIKPYQPSLNLCIYEHLQLHTQIRSSSSLFRLHMMITAILEL